MHPAFGRFAAALVTGLAAFLLSMPAAALIVNCTSSFVDVPDDTAYCQAADWLKSRGITVGCTDNMHFCPDDSVTRGQMALFLDRLGGVLTPQFLHTDDTYVTATNGVQCVLGPIGAATYNRVATGNASAYYSAGASGAYSATRLVYSLDGTSWQNWAQFYIPATVPANGNAAASSTSTALIVAAGQTPYFAVRTEGNSNVSGGCEIRVRLDHTNAVLLF